MASFFPLFAVLLITGIFHSDSLQQNAKDENGIFADPLVHCGIDSLLLDIRTQRPFSGRVFVKGFSRQSECQFLGNGTTTAIKFGVQFDRCGLRRSREVSGVSVAAVVVVSFHPLLITKSDRAFRLNCFYSESHKMVAQQLEVGQLSTSASIQDQHTMPSCRYDILWINANGQSIRFVKIGDTVYHRWSCQPETPTYCMRVHSCTVSDGQGGEAVEVLDKRGCAVDGLLIRDLDYLGDLSAGQSASVFKFADKPTLHFNCQIELTQHDSTRDCSVNVSINSLFFTSSGFVLAPKIEEANAVDPNLGDDESYGANRLPAEQPPFTTRWNFASGLFVPGIATEKALGAAQFRLMPNKMKEWASEETLGQTQVKPSRQSREFESVVLNQRHETVDDDLAEQQQNGLDAMRARRELGYRRVADFDLPERSLVVIDVDEHSVAQQQPLPWHLLNASAFGGTKGERCHVQLEHKELSWHILLAILFLLLSFLTFLLWTNLMSQNWRRKMKYIVNGTVGKRRKKDKSAEKEKRRETKAEGSEERI
ncbi:hypothetical protein niasHS_010962 [Heterodera schachtii]|uniref:ZP domain-containing protein n=1 Tax=Heterodera schachtii TaxID=97005 RepID=A0ABD2J0P2_HETSC